MLKAFSGRFGFDALRPSQPPKLSVRNKVMRTSPKVCSMRQVIHGCLLYIGVGLLALFFLTDRVMRRFLKRESGTGLAPRFCLYVANLKQLTSAMGAVGGMRVLHL
jgi:hypothetical protein